MALYICEQCGGVIDEFDLYCSHCGGLFDTSDAGYLKWKRRNVTLRGMKSKGVINKRYGSFGAGLYTAFLSNRGLAKSYGRVYFTVNAIPKKPKKVSTLNEAEIWVQTLISKFCEKHGVSYSPKYFEDHTSIEAEMKALGYDGLIIKGREMVNYTPSKDVKYFETEQDLKEYYNQVK